MVFVADNIDEHVALGLESNSRLINIGKGSIPENGVSPQKSIFLFIE